MPAYNANAEVVLELAYDARIRGKRENGEELYSVIQFMITAFPHQHLSNAYQKWNAMLIKSAKGLGPALPPWRMVQFNERPRGNKPCMTPDGLK